MCWDHEFENEYGFDAEITRIIRIKARQAVERTGFQPDEAQDIEQEVAAELHAALPRYDERKARRTTFAARVIERRITKIMSERTALKRGNGHTIVSLHDTVRTGDGEEFELIELIDQEEVLLRTGRLSRPFQEQADLAIDMRESLDGLSDKLRDVADGLQRLNPSELSRETGTPRSTLYESIDKVRDHLTHDGLVDYR
jgi:RNA polymerase sigma-70 factor, ECF subfamily